MFNRIIENFSNRIHKYKHLRTQMDINKYVTIPKSWDVSDYSREYINELNNIQETIYRFAKKNNIHVDMFIPEDDNLLQVTVSRFNSENKRGVNKASMDLLLNYETSTVVKVKRLMIKNKDGVKYKTRGISTFEDSFIRRVYRAVDDLTKTLTTK